MIATRFSILLRCLCATGIFALASCVNHRIEAPAVLDGAELVQAEHFLDDDSTVALVIRSHDGKLWSVRHTLARPQQIVFGDAGGRRWKTTNDPDVARLLQRLIDQELERMSRRQEPPDNNEKWKIRTLGELGRRLMSGPHGLSRR